ncbi:MAG: glycoside hydrolase family 27 protein [Opitutaceae bacterium]|jgi:alpha-galactosidase
MNKFLAISILGLLLTAAQAADLTGTWRIDQKRQGGVALRSYLVLQQKGDMIGGKVIINETSDLQLLNLHQEGEETVFSTTWNIKYRLRPDGKNLKVTIIYGRGSKEETVAIPVDESETRPPAPLPLPALEDIPCNGMAKTPPMGWNSWNHFGEAVDDKIVRETADAMAGNGMAAAGYLYVNIDDTWEGSRDADGNIQTNGKFPDMKALADYVHSRGLKLGIYSSPGPVTCGGYLGSYGHEEQDAKTYATWGIDYLKYDWCSAGRIYPDSAIQAGYQKMGKALQICGRPIVYSACEYGKADVWTWGPKAGANLWRTTGDIQDNWESMSEIGFNQSRLAPYAGPGHWNDPDMLEVGNGGMTNTEYKAHFSLWCLLAAPLMAGNDPRKMSPETLEILTNREVIAVNQDVLGKQGQRIAARDGIEIWTKELHDGSQAVGVFNRNTDEKTGKFTWAEIGLSAKPEALRDLWLHKDLEPAQKGCSGTIPGHGVMLLIVK